MLAAWLVLLCGLGLVFLEFYLPGGVIGAIGGLFFATALVMAALRAESGMEIFIFALVSFVSLGATIALAMRMIQRFASSGSIYLASDQEGYRSASYPKELIGEKGVCRSDLRPGGFVRVNEKKYAAISIQGFLEKGQEIVVDDVEGETLKVKLWK